VDLSTRVHAHDESTPELTVRRERREFRTIRGVGRRVRLTARESWSSEVDLAQAPHPTRAKSPDRAMAIEALDMGSPINSGR